jgi:GTP cyclohydrolase II
MGIKQIADVNFTTHWANFHLLTFEGLHVDNETKKEHQETALALILGDVHSTPPIVRIHSQCATGDIFTLCGVTATTSYTWLCMSLPIKATEFYFMSIRRAEVSG